MSRVQYKLEYSISIYLYKCARCVSIRDASIRGVSIGLVVVIIEVHVSIRVEYLPCVAFW